MVSHCSSVSVDGTLIQAPTHPKVQNVGSGEGTLVGFAVAAGLGGYGEPGALDSGRQVLSTP